MFRKVRTLMLMLCLAALCIVSAVKADGPAWERSEYDLARTHYYPYGSSYEISFDDFQPAWIVPVATQAVLTGDINGDGKLEVVSWDAPNIRVFDNEGQELWTVPISGFVREPSLLDATGDGIPEIAVGRRTSSDSLQILVYDGSGTLLKTIGKTGGYDSNIRPWLAADCNSDGTIEILAIQDAAWSNDPRGVSLFDYETGQELWYYDMGPQIGTAAVGDIDEDGDLEVIKDASTVFNGAWGCGVNGQNTCTYDNAVATIVVDACTGDEDTTIFYSPERGWLFHAIVDLDRSGDANILCFRGHDSYYPGTMNILLLDDQGDTLSTWAYDGPENRFARGGGWAIADVDADSREEIIVCDCNALYGVMTDYVMRIIDDDLGQQIAVNETVVNADNNQVTINVADLNGDGINDILITDKENGKLRVLDATLNEMWSFDAPNIRQIALSDLNDDGIPEILIAGDSLIVLSAPVPNSLILPSVSVLPCDDSCVVQPVQIQASDAIAGATIPVGIPAGVEVCGWSREGLVTEDWDFVFDTVAEDYALINLANLQGDVIEPGTTTVAYLLFHAQPECQTSYYIHWDTTLSDDPSKQLKFSDAFGQAVNPGFDPGLDSTEILGFTPGDFGNDGSVDIADLVALIDYMFRDGPPPCVMDAVDANGDCGGPDIADLVYLINYMFLDGPAPVCGCISSGVAAKVVAHPEVMVTTSVDNGVTTILLAAPFDLRGLDLELAGPDGAAPVKLVGDALDMVYGQKGDRVKIGILDLDGGNVIPAGQNRVIQIAGEYEVVSAVVATDGYTTYAATIGEAAKGGSLPAEFSLSQNYPNPFNPVTTISFSLPVASHVTLEVYNVMGQRVTTVADGFYEAGVHACEWDGSAVASGVYFYRIETPEFVETKKMMLLK